VIDMTSKLIKTAMFGLALTLFACGDASKDAGKKDGDKKPPAGKTDKGEIAEKDKPTEEPEVEAPSLDPKVEQAVTLANKISAQPDAADSILEEAGLDRESFEKLLYEIARDPELSKSYAVAREA
jgi:hypothetical protein